MVIKLRHWMLDFGVVALLQREANMVALLGAPVPKRGRGPQGKCIEICRLVQEPQRVSTLRLDFNGECHQP